MYHPRFHSLEGFPLTVSFQGPVWVGNSGIATTHMSVHLYNNPAHPWTKIKCFATLACHQGPSMPYKCEVKERCDETGMYAGLCSTRVLPVWLMLNPRCATSILPYLTSSHIESLSSWWGILATWSTDVTWSGIWFPQRPSSIPDLLFESA